MCIITNKELCNFKNSNNSEQIVKINGAQPLLINIGNNGKSNQLQYYFDITYVYSDEGFAEITT